MKTPFYRILYVQVLIAVALGILLGHFYPSLGVDMKPLGDAFIKLIRMLIGLIIFCTVVAVLPACKVWARSVVSAVRLIYFEVGMTLALIIGLLAAHLMHPGAGFNVDPASIDTKSIGDLLRRRQRSAEHVGVLDAPPFLETMIGASAKGDILQILFSALLFGSALSMLGEKSAMITDFIGQVSKVFFRIVNIVTKVAPIGAFGAMAFTIGKYGIVSLVPMLKLIGCFYLTAILFVLIVLVIVSRLTGFSILRFMTSRRAADRVGHQLGLIAKALPH